MYIAMITKHYVRKTSWKDSELTLSYVHWS